MHERIIIQSPSAGFPNPNRPKRRIHATILNSITFFIPNFLRKKGMVRIKRVSEICETDIIIAGYLTAIRSLYFGMSAKSCRKDRKSTCLNSSHGYISYAVFCLKNKQRRKWKGTRRGTQRRPQAREPADRG